MKLFKKYWLMKKNMMELLIKRANDLPIKEGHLKEYLEIQSLKEDLIKLLQKKRFRIK